MKFSEALKYIRSVQGLSQEQLARKLNVSFATINRWENEQSKPRGMAVDMVGYYCKDNGIELDIEINK